MGERLPLYDEVAARLLFDPRQSAHEWRESPLPDDEFSHITPEWTEQADVLIGDEHPDVWIGVTRSELPVTERPREERPWRGL